MIASGEKITPRYIVRARKTGRVAENRTLRNSAGLKAIQGETKDVCGMSVQMQGESAADAVEDCVKDAVCHGSEGRARCLPPRTTQTSLRKVARARMLSSAQGAPPPEECEQRPVQLVYRSTVDADEEGKAVLQFLDVSQSDGTFLLGNDKLQTMRQLALLLAEWRTPDGTTLKTGERRKAFELDGDQFAVDVNSRPLGYGEQADVIRLGQIVGRPEQVALKRHHTITAAWVEFLATFAAQGPGVIPVYGISVDSALSMLAFKAYKNCYGLNNFMHEGETETVPLLALMLKLARTIGRVHELKVAHLDLKIANIMIDTATGDWIVIDFGLAKTDAKPEHFQQDGGFLRAHRTPSATLRPSVSRRHLERYGQL